MLNLANVLVHNFAFSIFILSVLHLASENETTNGNSSPRDLYEGKVKTGELRRDEYQMAVVEELQQLHTKLRSYKPIPYVEATGFFSKVIEILLYMYQKG